MKKQKKKKPKIVGGREAVRKAVASAVLQLIVKGDLEFKLGDVSTLSGIHRTTVHRRWPTRNLLLREGLSEHNSQFRFAGTGKFKQDLRRLTRSLRSFFSNPIEMALAAVDATTRDEDYHRQVDISWLIVRRQLESFFREAIDAGDVRPDIDMQLLHDMIAAPISGHIIFRKQPPTDQYLDRLVDYVIRAIR